MLRAVGILQRGGGENLKKNLNCRAKVRGVNVGFKWKKCMN